MVFVHTLNNHQVSNEMTFTCKCPGFLHPQHRQLLIAEAVSVKTMKHAVETNTNLEVFLVCQLKSITITFYETIEYNYPHDTCVINRSA